MPRRATLTSIAAAAALWLGACGSDGEQGGRPRVVATTGVLAELAAGVAGPRAEVEQLVPDGASPHDFQLSAEDRLALEDADLVVANGAGLEAPLGLDESDAPRWELAAQMAEPLALGDGDGTDPHVWLDPARVAAALPSLAGALAGADPANAESYRRRARDQARRLRELDRELRATLAAIPPERRLLVTSHDALGYLADRYGLEVAGTAFPATGPEGEPSAADLAELAELVRAEGVPAVFAAAEDDPEALRLVAEAAGVAVVDDLLVESVGAAGSYEGMLRHDAERIAAALAQ